jgi:hypothetical protein
MDMIRILVLEWFFFKLIYMNKSIKKGRPLAQGMVTQARMPSRAFQGVRALGYQVMHRAC